MLKNYLKVALRNLRKYKGYTSINVIGLAVGMAVCLLIFSYVSHELSYDRYHEKSDRIYRVTLDHPSAHLAVTPSMIYPTLRQLYPEIEAGVRLLDVGSYQPQVVRNGERVFEERSFAFADSSLFAVFDFELLAGEPESALARPNTVVISRDMARKYFDTRNPVGRSLEGGGRQYEVTGVMENIPRNSHFRFDFFASLTTRSDWSELSDNTWRAANFYTYLTLAQDASVANLDKEVNEYLGEMTPDNEFLSALDINFQPLADIHLYSDTESDIAPQGDIRYVLAASAVAILILIIACINYMNLATARSVRRSREVGIRKVLGAGRRRLIGQFYGEAAFMTLLAIGVSVLLVELSLPWFNRLAGTALSVDYASFTFWSMILGTGLLVTMLAGSYPALMLSSFRPSAVLKGAKISGGSSRLRKGLVVFQFAASIFLIIGTMVIYRQIDFIQQKELGYKQENVLVLNAYSAVEDRFEALEAELSRLPGVEGAAMASETPTNIRAGYDIDVEGLEEGPNFQITGLRAHPNFTEALNIGTVAGEPFTRGDLERANPEEGDGEYAFLVNEALARHYGVEPRELIGRQATMSGRTGLIKGVVKDFHFSSLHRSIEPLVLFPQDGYNKLMVSFNTDDSRSALEGTREVWNTLFPQYPFEYRFLDQEYNALYQQETRAGSIFTSFAGLAVFIACLGLVGLASYMVERRRREIGIRKVLGATSTGILTLFSKDFMGLVALGFLVALPVGWYVMSEWLQNFAYRVDIGLTVYLVAGGLTLAVALLTVSYQALRAAHLDPAESLRSE